MKKAVLYFYLFGTLGISTEVVFTALTDNFVRFNSHLPLDLKLQGKSYIWMFFIYGLASLLLPLVHPFTSKYPRALRLLLMALGIFTIEFITGFLLDKITGQCPWEYHSRWAILGYIRLDYLPVWLIFAFMMEEANALFEKMLKDF